MPTDINILNKIILGCFFFIGLITGSVVSMIIQEVKESRRRRIHDTDS